MAIDHILSAVENEMSRLAQVRDFLLSSSSKGLTSAPLPSPVSNKTRPPLSADARARIAAAQKKRWAAQKKAAKKVAKSVV